MRALRLAVALMVALGLAGCAQHQDPVMPDVTGKRLDVAKSDIKRAGFTTDVEVLGGGLLGVLKESNWQVCDQSPAEGQAVTEAPRLTIDRSCGDDNTAPAESQSESTDTPSGPASESAPAPSPSATAKVLTAENSKAFGALLAEDDYCDGMNEGFAAKYEGQTVLFDGSISAMNHHGGYKTRYDILVSPGDHGPASTDGPEFQFLDVNIFDLNLVGSDVPDSIGVGDKLRIKAELREYSGNGGCLFILNPIATELR